MNKIPLFPKDFFWGTATAAYQIEGAASEDGRGPSIWDTFSHTPGKTKNGDTGDVACDHYHHLEEDLDLIAGLVPHYRFSISWSRILPEGTGEINQKGVDFYNRLIDGLIARGVTPWVTLYHWDLPQALQDRGGWVNRDIIDWFNAYAEVCVRLFGDRVKNWMIINEQVMISYFGYATGFFAPGIQDEEQYWRVVHNTNLVVGSCYRMMKSMDPSLNIGSTYTPIPCRMHNEEDNDKIPLLHCIFHYNFLDPLFTGAYPDVVADKVQPYIKEGDAALMKVDLDFLGLQHYSPIYFKKNDAWVLGVEFAGSPDGLPTSDLGWVIDPDAFRDILLELHAKYPGVVWLVTENGVSLDDKYEDGAVSDPRRIAYLTDYLCAVREVMDAGMDVRGYFVWSLMDNYEWASGYGPRFGLIFIDYERDQARICKESYGWYKKLIVNQAGQC